MDCKAVVGLGLVVLSVVSLVGCLLKKNESFFNLREVIVQHLSLFKDDKSQYVVFYVLPLLFSIGLSLLYTANDDLYEQISVIVSIILSILLAVLSIITSKDYRISQDPKQNERVQATVVETINTIMFATFICVFIMICSLVMIVVDGVPIHHCLRIVLSCGAFFCFTVLILTVLMIVKRINRIIQFEMNVKKGNK